MQGAARRARRPRTPAPTCLQRRSSAPRATPRQPCTVACLQGGGTRTHARRAGLPRPPRPAHLSPQQQPVLRGTCCGASNLPPPPARSLTHSLPGENSSQRSLTHSLPGEHPPQHAADPQVCNLHAPIPRQQQVLGLEVPAVGWACVWCERERQRGACVCVCAVGGACGQEEEEPQSGRVRGRGAHLGAHPHTPERTGT